MEKQQKDFDYEVIKKKTLEQIRSGKCLFGKDGAFAPMLKDILEAALEAEMEAHLQAPGRELGNRRNGKSSKMVKTKDGSFDLETPRDRHCDFEPQIVRKRETILAENLEEKVLGLYGLGMSFRDISDHIEEMYDTQISATTLSMITDKVIPKVQEWQNRSLDKVYCIVWLDAMYFKTKEDGHYKTKCLYNILGIKQNGHKEILGCYIGETEGSKFWLSVLTNLQTRGVKDILIACTDNLKGFSEAIINVFPHTEVQSCIVHQIRNSLKYVASKDQKEFMRDLKIVYRSITKQEAEIQLKELVKKWYKKYKIVTDSWENNWEKLSTYYKYPDQIRKMVYTTNTIEGYHRQIRKVTKTKGAFTSDTALLKLVYLATQNISKKWNKPLPNWCITIAQLSIIFPDRINLDI